MLKTDAEVTKAQFILIIVELKSVNGKLNNLYGFTVNMMCIKPKEPELVSVAFTWDPDAPQPYVSSIN